MKMTQQEKKDTKAFLAFCKNTLNDGGGVIVPEHIGNILLSNGFKEEDGFIISRLVPVV